MFFVKKVNFRLFFGLSCLVIFILVLMLLQLNNIERYYSKKIQINRNTNNFNVMNAINIIKLKKDKIINGNFAIKRSNSYPFS